jgi:large subunit ribosomal protein L22
MEVRAKAKFIRMSPKKIRLVVDLIRGKSIDKALDQLKFINKKASLSVSKLIESAIANAVNNFELDRNNLFIKEIFVDEGPTLKRWMPKAFGRATPIRKRSSHINLLLAEIKDSGVKKAKKQKLEAPISLEKQAKKISDKEEKKDSSKDKEKDISDLKPDKEKHAKIEGGGKGFAKKIFRRKAG